MTRSPHDFRSRRSRIRAVCASLLLVGAATSTAAAPLVGADPVGLCAGLPSCFTTVQAAVDNAGPGPSEVRIFPGVYPEGVDLQAMGGAVGAQPDDLTLVAVDAGGLPMPGAARIDPGAPGGPGSGMAITTGSSDLFPGDLVVDGLDLRSPDATCLLVAVDGGVGVHDVNAQSCGVEGIAIALATTVQIVRSEVRLSGGNGYVVFASAAVTVEDSIAERNDGNGFVVVGSDVTVTSSVAIANVGFGFFVSAHHAALVSDSQSVGNEYGFVVADLLSAAPDPFAAAQRAGRLPGGPHRDVRESLRKYHERARRWQAPVAAVHDGGLHLRVADSIATDNLEEGLLAQGETVEIEGLMAGGNGNGGAFISGDSVEVLVSVFDGNRFGAFLHGGDVSLASSEASDNTAELALGGFVIAADQASVSFVRARRNEHAGILLLGSDLPWSATISDSLTEENLFGVLLQPPVETGSVVVLEGLISRRNGGGVTFVNTRDLRIRNSELSENTVGINGFVGEVLDVALTTLADNAQGGATLSLGPASQAVLRCSNLSGNTAHGARLSTPGVLDARHSFWGDASGPIHPGNPGGTGDRVVDGSFGGDGTILYSTFLDHQASAADCALAVVEVPATGPGARLLLIILLAGLALGMLPRATL